MRRLEPFYLLVIVNKNECSGTQINEANVANGRRNGLKIAVLAISVLCFACQISESLLR